MNGAETFYYQRDNSNWRQDGEDNGYLFNMCHNWEENQCYLMIWDAKTMKLQCKAKLQTRVPYGFHSYFVQEDDM